MCCDNAASEIIRMSMPEVTGYRFVQAKLELTAPGKIIALVRKIE
jgi:hypothetical protein